jgi:4-hydroxy-3-polyprenylbenzoate decarboxylase
MDDIVAAQTQSAQDAQPPLDLQEHIADLEARGLITRIDHPVNKDTELHPLVRLQFIGGIPENERRAFLFTNVVDGSGRRYDMPVVVGAIAASAEIYSQGMRRAVDEIGTAWIAAIANPIAPVWCPRALPGGRHQGRPAQADGGLKLLPVGLDAGLRSAPYLTATFAAAKDPGSGNQKRHLPRGAQGV